MLTDVVCRLTVTVVLGDLTSLWMPRMSSGYSQSTEIQ